MISVSIRYKKKKKRKDELLKVAVIGCGGGALMHQSHYLWHEKTIVDMVHDIDSKRFNDIKTRFPFAYKDINYTTNFNEIISNEEIDIVSIATPDHTHAEYAIAALEAGKHVLCEKPMCTTLNDADKIIEATKKTEKVFSVFQQMRFVTRNKIVKSYINNGDLGEIFFISVGYIHDMRKRAFEFSDWRKDPINHQHPIFGGQHNIDLLRWLAGDVEEVKTISSNKGFPEIPVDDTYIIQMKLKNGGVANILTCFGPRVKQEYHPLRLYGTKGSAHGNEIMTEKNGEIHIEKIKNASYGGVPQFRAQISSFIDAVVSGDKKDVVTAEDAYNTVAVCIAAIESLDKGQSIKVDNFRL